MKFEIKRVLTKHFITHDKDYALCELAFFPEEGDMISVDDEFVQSHRYGSVEYGVEIKYLADVCSAPTIAEAIQMRNNQLEIAERLAQCDNDPNNPEFINWMMGRLKKGGARQ